MRADSGSEFHQRFEKLNNIELAQNFTTTPEGADLVNRVIGVINKYSKTYEGCVDRWLEAVNLSELPVELHRVMDAESTIPSFTIYSSAVANILLPYLYDEYLYYRLSGEEELWERNNHLRCRNDGNENMERYYNPYIKSPLRYRAIEEQDLLVVMQLNPFVDGFINAHHTPELEQFYWLHKSFIGLHKMAFSEMNNTAAAKYITIDRINSKGVHLPRRFYHLLHVRGM
jgi:hypothetical protein